MRSEDSLEKQERLRYLEYFQKKLVREGTEHFLLGQKQWFEHNRNRLASEYAAIMARGGNAAPALNPFISHQDETEHDSVFARSIFSPILSKALQASSDL